MKVNWIRISYASLAMVNSVLVYSLIIKDLSVGWTIFSALVFPFIGLLLIFLKPIHNIKNIRYTPMSEIYMSIPRSGNVDEILRFNLGLCAYCRYEGSKGAIMIIDLEHLSSMKISETLVAKMILDKMKEQKSPFFMIQKDISPYTFSAQ
jgi:hypothetical protein